VRASPSSSSHKPSAMPQSSDQSANEREKFPEHFTFSQRYGYEPLPEPMRLEYLSDDLRRELCNAVVSFLENDFWVALIGAQALKEDSCVKQAPWLQGFQPSRQGEDAKTRGERYIKDEKDRNYKNFDIKRDIYTKRVLGKLNRTLEINIQIDREKFLTLSNVFMKEKYNRVLDFLEIMFHVALEEDWSGTSKTVKTFAMKIKKLLEDSAPYRLEISQPPYWFFPCTSKEEGEAVQQAIKVIRQGGMKGAVTHLSKAAKFINTGDHSDSIRESIHAVESIARTIDPASSKSLGPALKSLEEAGLLKHKALKEAFNMLYGYTSDEQGIRHSLLDKSSADVGPDEAIFMFGACASFAAYLSKKHQTTGRA